MVVILDLRTVEDLEAHSCENIDHLILCYGKRMETSGRTHLCRHRDIDLLALIAGCELQLIHLILHFLVAGFYLVLKFIDRLSDVRALLLRNTSKTLHQVCDAAFLAKEALPELTKLFLGLYTAESGFHLLLQCFDLLFHSPPHSFGMVLHSISARTKKTPSRHGTKLTLRGTTQIPHAFMRHSNVCNGTSRPALLGSLSHRLLKSEFTKVSFGRSFSR